MIKIRNILKRCAALACAAAIGVSTLATSASAAVSGVTIKYEWNSSVNPTLYTTKNAVSGGVNGQYLRYGEQICRFSPSSSNGYAFKKIPKSKGNIAVSPLRMGRSENRQSALLP